jgi:hypothetical protein
MPLPTNSIVNGAATETYARRNERIRRSEIANPQLALRNQLEKTVIARRERAVRSQHRDVLSADTPDANNKGVFW